MGSVNKAGQAHLRLKRLYEERIGGMTQEQFAKKYGIGTKAMIWQYLSGYTPLNLEAAAKFARGLRCTIYDISPEMAETIRQQILPVLGIDSKPIVPMNLATRIRARREALGLSADQLAEAVGVSLAVVHQWESGDVEDLNPERLFKIADVLKADARELALGNEAGMASAVEAPTSSETFWERLRTAARYAGIDDKQSVIARALGLSRQTVNRWSKDGGMASAEILAIAARKWGVDPYWLATGQGQVVAGSTSPEAQRLVHRSGHTRLSEAAQATPALDAKEIARRLRVAMDSRSPKLTSVELARACGVSKQAVYEWRSQGRIAKKHLQTITMQTGKSLEFFLVPGGDLSSLSVESDRPQSTR
jgi:transcriptional regulator with XRE-family HTH domain